MIKHYTPLWNHQKLALEEMIPHKRYALFTDMGTGKTKIMLDLINSKDFKNVLIVCPCRVCSSWVNQIRIHAPNLQDRSIDLSCFSGKKKIEKMKDKSVLIVNYESIWRMPFSIEILKTKFDCVICDESHRIKSPSSKVSKFLTRLGRLVENRFIVTGTPLAENPCDIYSQYRFLDPSIFGTNFSVFCKEYQNINVFASNAVGYKVLDKQQPYKNLEQLRQKMFSCACSVESDIELPETLDIDVPFKLNKSAQKSHAEIIKEGIVYNESNTLTAENTLAMFVKLEQITSGFLVMDNKEILRCCDNRIKTLEELVLQTNQKIVVFYKFNLELKDIEEVCSDNKREFFRINGSLFELEDWNRSSNGILICQISSGSDGIDLSSCSYCIYYRLPTSLRQYEQSRKRTHRFGQKNNVKYYHIIAENTIDERIIELLRKKQEIIVKNFFK